jgi:predicted glycogen debranching enzyme
MIEFTQEVCANTDDAQGREWLETNGLGGFASSSIVGLNTRRYHGLLVAATRPPVGRLVLLSKLEETLVIDGRRYELSANRYPDGVVHPRGNKYLRGFRLDPFPVFTYAAEGVELEKSVFMVQGENTTVVQYNVKTDDGAPRDVRLEARPLIAFRDYHSTTHENGAIDAEVKAEDSRLTIRPYQDLPALHFAHDAEEVDGAQWWNRNLEYSVERERGLDYVEDNFSPFALKFDMNSRTNAAIIASTEPRDVRDADAFRRTETARRAALLARSLSEEELVRALTAAADSYVVARAEGKTVIAGYHWFSDWGRDTMIALPGLTLVTGRTDVAKSVLLEFARHVDRGMLPNRFPDAGEAPEYNTVDATLWFFEAVRALLNYTNDYEFVRANLYAVLKEIVEWHERGTRYRIHVEDDGLLFAGEPGVQLTWMDARVNGREITPRTGKPVEIQALWYNALRVMESLAREFGLSEDETKYAAMASRARVSFNRQFWNEEAGCLYDVVAGDARDASIRPNQIIAASLTHSMLSEERARRVVEVVERELLTPYGLRSLAQSDPRYVGRYEGGPESRDAVYHQGTVWAWLLGPFITAYVKANGRGQKSKQQAAAWLAPLREHLKDAGLGHVSEIFDGDAPHTPRGCIAQAWSVAEILRAAVEDVYERATAEEPQRPAAQTTPPSAPTRRAFRQPFASPARWGVARLL